MLSMSTARPTQTVRSSFRTIKTGPQTDIEAKRRATKRKLERAEDKEDDDEGERKHARKLLQVVDPNYFDPQLVYLTDHYLTGVEECETATKKDKPKKPFTLKGGFSEKPRKNIDCDLNDFAERSFVSRWASHQRHLRCSTRAIHSSAMHR